MKSFQALQSPAIPLTSFHDLLVLLISSFIALRHVPFSLPLLLYPWGFQANAVFSIAPVSLRNVCSIQFHFLLFIWFSVDFWWAILHSSLFVISLVHFIFIIHLKHLFTNICSLLVIWLAVFQVSQAYNNTDFTFVLNIRFYNNFFWCAEISPHRIEEDIILLKWLKYLMRFGVLFSCNSFFLYSGWHFCFCLFL